MKLATYNPVVDKNTISGVRIRTFDDGSANYMRQAAAITNAEGARAAETGRSTANAIANIGQMQGRSMQGLANALQNAGEQIDAVNVQAASNEYTKRLNDLLYNQDDGLMNTKMQGAEGISQKYEEAERKIRQEVGSKYQFFSAKGNIAFNRMTENSAAQRYEMVRRHQTQQYEAYRDVTFNNGLQLNMQTAAENYAAPDIVDENIKEAVMSASARYFGQGAEVVKMQSRKAAGQVAQQAINMAYANGNDNQAAAYIEKYGALLDPNTRTQYSKAVHQRVLSNLTRNTAEALVAKYGNNPAALYAAIYQNGEGGSGYDGAAAVAWMKEQANNGISWGVNTCTLGVNKALQMGGGIPGNTWAPTNWEDAKKAGIAFTNRNQLQNGDIVYWDHTGEGEPSHVGIYDASTGMVYQSGTSGFSAMKLDTDGYKVMGFARPQGQGMSAEQKDALYNSCLRQLNQQKALRNAYNDNVYKDLDKQLMGLSDAGNADFATYTAMVDQVCGADPEMRRKGYQYAQYWWKRVAGTDEDGNITGRGTSRSSTGSNKGGLAVGAEYGLTQMLMHNDFESQADWAQYIMRFNPSKAEYNKLMTMYQQKQKGEGAFAFDWNGMKDQFKLDNPKLDTNSQNVAWRQAQDYAISMINKSRRDGKEPTYAEVYGYIMESMSKVNMGDTITPGMLWDTKTAYEPTKGELAQAGITATRHVPNTNQIEVTYANGVTEITTAEGLQHKLSYRPVVTDDYK